MYRYDDLQAFDGSPIEIEYDTGDKVVSVAWVVFNQGGLVKKYTNPTNPIEVELDSDDTAKLLPYNVVKLILFDEDNRKKTCDGQLEFTMDKEVYIESEVQITE